MRDRARLRLSVSGAVQGVGFRPHVFRLATGLDLGGSVRNTAAGVLIEVEGSSAALEGFADRLVTQAPKPACVEGIAREHMAPRGETRFSIVPSDAAGGGALVPPDLATCPDCVADLWRAGGRHRRYHATACAACGPRFSVIENLPYDRERTTLAAFPPCPACARDYADPANRRFHAETQACADCGPHLRLCDAAGAQLASGPDAVRQAAALLRDGRIVCVKGIGGFHLLCRADSEAAVAELRRRKRRPAKPFAVLFPALRAVADWCEIADGEAAALQSRAAPIVLLARREGCGAAARVAPGRRRLGAMLPYAPLQHLLLADLALPVVATSANRTAELLIFRDDEALASCTGLADAVLLHDRAILRPVEDSVVQVVGGRETVLRLGRGHAPRAIRLAAPVPPLLAVGGGLKNAPAVTVGDTAVLGPQLGDLDQPATLAAHLALVDDLCRLHGVTPGAVACDANPDDAAAAAAAARPLPRIRVPHHLAHVASAMAEHGLAGPVIGLAWDGAGAGTDGTIWGGEVLRVEGAGWWRLAHLHPFRLPGGDAAAREPLRAALGVVAATYGADPAEWPAVARAALAGAAARLLPVWRSPALSPLTSSAGRLIDAVAALLGLCRHNSFEGEAAMALEDCADPDPDHGYRFAAALDWRPALRALFADLARDVPRATIAGRFYRGLTDAASALAAGTGVSDVVLTGGCFQSRLVTAQVADALVAAGMTVHRHRRVPPGDGGLALGQLEWARRLAMVA